MVFAFIRSALIVYSNRLRQIATTFYGIIDMAKHHYFYVNSRLPNDAALTRQINSAAERLYNKLIGLDLKELGISEYNQRYLGSKLANLVGALQLYSYLLGLSLDGNKLPLEEFVFVDYGGGSGVYSLLAKELGIGRVIYNDIYDVSCDDAKKVAQAIAVGVDDFVCGDLEELILHVDKHSLAVNAISSFDVIEHIYDMEDYLKKLRVLCNNHAFRAVFGTDANIRNPFVARRLRKFHLRSEYEDKELKWGDKKRDSPKSCLSLRKRIISDYDRTLNEETIERIAKQTRGLMKHDIEKCIDEYKESGNISYAPDDPTNTCDPYTGNWSEHLMEPEWLENILKKNGARGKILSGYFASNDSDHFIKRFAKSTLNMTIRHLGKKSLPYSNYFVLVADYQSPRRSEPANSEQ